MENTSEEQSVRQIPPEKIGKFRKMPPKTPPNNPLDFPTMMLYDKW
jgi:hypothetical protein